MAIIIDRFEGDFAVVEINGQAKKDISKTDIPVTAKEGDVIKFVNGMYEIDVEETKRIKDEVEKMMRDLWR
ncbi:DUF3006 domain-containing protein [Desulfosporosinus sp. BG]|uniref:DUF3006 domain-containing protein n=1 Tax=Desulfosporosinus sp. BG TaxID=1633135 RepID=UPI00083A3EB0|nr:DUF3006 domain-containing protein [Desulfosporosinus sp. BG]ODA40993.1 hypothetical protein DSBG_2168 [Desulfosporosinus sp. BG]